MHTIFLAILAAAVFSTPAFANPALDSALNALADEWDAVLGPNIRPDGGVDYRAVSKEKLSAFIDKHTSLDIAGASDDQKKATYINLYNALMIHNILRHAMEKKLDVNSPQFTTLKINDISVPGGNIWNGDYKTNLAGQQVHLDNIEHDLVRGQGSGALSKLKVSELDPRIHAAVNCAALSCPRVREKAYRAATINATLEENIREWLSSNEQFRKKSDSTLQANSIVFWYYTDFDGHAQNKAKLAGAGDYLAQFIAEGTPDRDWKVKHLKSNFNDRSKITLKLSSAFAFEYNWQINDVRNKDAKSH
jgi:hypothetical protein